jgi:hypothetical protein
MKFLHVLGLSFFLISCSNNIEQEYKDYTEFLNATLRHQSWFPDLIAKDCYNFWEIHSVEKNNSLGKFSYTDTSRMNSTLSDTTKYERIDPSTFASFLQKIDKPEQPDWLLSNVDNKRNEYYRKGVCLLIKNNQDKLISFIYSSE